MHAACLVAEFDNHTTVEIAVEVLRKSNFHPDAISIVWKGHEAALEKIGRQQDHSENDIPRGLFAMANHFGIRAHDAAHYEARILEGAVIAIITSTPPRLDEAQVVMKTTGPECLKRFGIHDEAKS